MLLKSVKTNILNDSINNFEVRIINSHGGKYQISSQIEKSQDSTTVFTQIIDMSNWKSDTILYFSTQEFIEKLDYEIKYSDSQIVAAGNYQTITVYKKNKEMIFYTRKAFGVMSLFTKGKSNRIENTNN